METENFKEARDIFKNAIEIRDPAEQKSYLDNACGGDQTRTEVQTCAATGANVTIDESGDDGEGSDDTEGAATAPLDLVYMLDLTGSMGSWIAEVRGSGV